ncbi:MAG: tRNA dihydrouridine(20/20a) synthase DusA [Legionellales bacterium]|jgi:tRNA-dihydrouridine synthase A
MTVQNPWQLSIAPMMAWTDRHYRYLMRLIAPNIRLYTEMVTTGALLNSDPKRHLAFSPQEHPIALQLGGHDPEHLAQCAKMGEDFGYDEININIGCPSDRVSAGRFGACLMAEPELVAECVASMQQSVNIPITVKTRIGIDKFDDYAFLKTFIETVQQAPCKTFIIHARKAWLKGLSPKQNREVPPLQYDTVYQIKKDYPHLDIIINGGITTKEQAAQHLQHVDGVMIGRSAYENPCYWAENPDLLRDEILKQYIDYMLEQHQHGERLWPMARHLLNLFNGQPGARALRRLLSTQVQTQDDQQALAVLNTIYKSPQIS